MASSGQPTFCLSLPWDRTYHAEKRQHMIFPSPHPPVTIPEVSLPELILTRAEHFGDKPALIDGPTRRSTSFVEVAAGVRRLAGGLAEAGFQKGDVLAMMSPNCPEYGMLFLASALLGGINTTLNPTSTPARPHRH